MRTDPHYAVRGLGGRVRTLNPPSSTGGRDDGTEAAGEGSCQTVGKVRVFEMLTGKGTVPLSMKNIEIRITVN